MARARRVCNRPRCPEVAGPTGRCERHAAEAEAARGTRYERGYGTQHDRQRKRLLPKAYGTLCPLCGEVMTREQNLDLHHSTPLMRDPTSVGDQIVHRRCNVAESNRTRNRLT